MITTEEWNKRKNTEFAVREVCRNCNKGCTIHLRVDPKYSEFGKEFDIKSGLDALAHIGMHSFFGFKCEEQNRWILGLI